MYNFIQYSACNRLSSKLLMHVFVCFVEKGSQFFQEIHVKIDMKCIYSMSAFLRLYEMSISWIVLMNIVWSAIRICKEPFDNVRNLQDFSSNKKTCHKYNIQLLSNDKKMNISCVLLLIFVIKYLLW